MSVQPQKSSSTTPVEVNQMVITRFTTFPFSLLIFQTLALISARPTFNISHYLYPKISEEHRPQPSRFLEDVSRAISLRQGWNNSEDVRVSKLYATNAKFGSSQRYDFRLRMGKTQLIFRLMDKVSSWKKMNVKKGGDFESFANEISSLAVLDAFRVEGPVELLVGGDDELSLQLPVQSVFISIFIAWFWLF